MNTTSKYLWAYKAKGYAPQPQPSLTALSGMEPRPTIRLPRPWAEFLMKRLPCTEPILSEPASSTNNISFYTCHSRRARSDTRTLSRSDDGPRSACPSSCVQRVKNGTEKIFGSRTMVILIHRRPTSATGLTIRRGPKTTSLDPGRKLSWA